jgi:hypothetical protein
MTTEQLIELFVMLIGGIIGMPITQWLKSKFGVDDTSALALSGAVAGILAVVALFAGGQLGLADFAWERLPATLAVVWSTAVLVYNLLRGRATA